jgi:hypothetical protein
MMTATPACIRPTTLYPTPTLVRRLEVFASSGYVRLEKQTVEDHRRGTATVANTVAKPLDKARPMRTAVECPPSARTATNGPRRLAQAYGSRGLCPSYACSVPRRGGCFKARKVIASFPVQQSMPYV